MSQLMTIEGLGYGVGDYELPLIEDFGDPMDTAKSLALAAGAGLAALLAGGIVDLYPEDKPRPQLVRPLGRIALGVGAYFALRNVQPQVAEVAGGLLLATGLYRLARPYLAKLPVIGPRIGPQPEPEVADIIVEDRGALSEMGVEERNYLAEVRQDRVELLPPALAEIVEEPAGQRVPYYAPDDDVREVAFFHGLSQDQGFDPSWLGG